MYIVITTLLILVPILRIDKYANPEQSDAKSAARTPQLKCGYFSIIAAAEFLSRIEGTKS